MPTCNDLATKAELQELRNQLNAVLGEKEGGGTATIFEQGLSPGAVGGLMVGTTFVATKNRAANAITELILSNPADSSLWQGLKSGATKIEAVIGKGTKSVSQGLTQVGSLLGKNVSATATAAKAAATSANAAGLAGDIANIGVSLALSLGTLKVLDKRIQAEAEGTNRAFDAANYGMIKLFQKQQGDIDAVNAELEINRQNVSINRQNIEDIRSEITDIEVANASLRVQMDILETQGDQTKAEIQAVRAEIDAFEIEVDEITTQLKANIAKIELSVDSALKSIAEQKVLINTAYEEIKYVKKQVANLDERISTIEVEIDELKVAFEELRADLQPQVELLDIKSKIQEARLIATEKKLTQAGSGGAPIAVTQGMVNAQNKLLELISKLSAVNTQFEEVSIEEMLNNPAAFNERFDQLIQGVQTGTMNPADMQNLRDGIKTDFGGMLDLKLGGSVIPQLDVIAAYTAPAAISSAVQTGVCQSLNGGGTCPTVPGNPNTINGLGGMNQRIQDAFNAMLTAMGAQDLAQGQNILGIVKNTNQVVNNAEHGLVKIQEFASKAWKATKADKVMNAVTTAVVIHNAIMLSNNLAITVSEAANLALDALGIKDESDNPIDIGAAVRGKIGEVMGSILGEANYKAMTTRIAAASRVYQASANVYNLVREIGDTTRSITEVACENTGKIGNALLESGAVFENAYDQMIDSVNPQSKAQLKLEKFRNGTEVLEDAAEAISSISSDVIELQELRQELTEGKAQLDIARESFKTTMETEKAEKKLESQVETDVNKADFAKDESEQQ